MKDTELASAASKQQAALQEQADDYDKQLARLQHDKELASLAMTEEIELLRATADDLDTRLAEALKLAAAKEDTLDGLRAQARMRENRMAELAKDVENKGKFVLLLFIKVSLLHCIGSAMLAL